MERECDAAGRAKYRRTLALASAAVFCSTSAMAWQVNLQGSAIPNGVAVAVAIDAFGNVLAGGRVINEGMREDFTVVKVTGDTGAVVWRREINGDLNDIDKVHAIAVDAAGDVVAAGLTRRQLIQGIVPDSDFTIVKFAGASGDTLWRQDINGTDDFPLASAEAVVVDLSGDVIAAGTTWNHHENMSPGSAGVSDFTVVKLGGATGDVLWRRDINGTHRVPADSARAVAVDTAGDVVATGTVRRVGTDSDFTVIKFSGVDGTELWQYAASGTRQVAGAGADEARLVRFDASGDVVAAGTIENADTGRDAMIVKLSADTGQELWRRVVNGIANRVDDLSSMALDSRGDALVTLKLDNSVTGNGFVVMKLAREDGADLWRWEFDGRDFPTADRPFGVAVDSKDDVVAVGVVYRSLFVSSFALFKLSGRTGEQIWQSETFAPHNGASGYAVTVDSFDNVIAVGTIDDYARGYFAVLKRRGTDGGDFGVSGTATSTRPTATATPSPTMTPKLDEVVFDVKVDRFQVTGNVFGLDGFVDDFDSDTLGVNWGSISGRRVYRTAPFT